MNSIPNPKPTLSQIKKFVKDTINGLKPEIDIPIEIPNLPKKEDFEAQLKVKTPTEEEIKDAVLLQILIALQDLMDFLAPSTRLHGASSKMI